MFFVAHLNATTIVPVASLLWVAYWGLIFIIHDLFLKTNGFNYLTSPYIISIFFLTATFLGYNLFKNNILANKLSNLKNISSLIILLLIVLFTFLSAYSVNQALPINENIRFFLLSNKMHSSFFTPLTTMAKLFDILFQQVLILSACCFFINKGIAKKKVSFLVGSLFLVLHLPLILIKPQIGFYFVLPSGVAGYIFAYLLTMKDRGILITLPLHICFYFVLTLIFRSIA